MRRPLLVPTLVALLGVALAPIAGCGFPDLQYVPGDAAEDSAVDQAVAADAAGDGTTHGDAPAEATLLDTSAPDQVTPPSDGAVEAVATESGTDAGADAPEETSAVDARAEASSEAAAEAGVDASVDCDVDKDGYKAAGGTCGGNDCCDTDGNAHPGQAMFFTAADACGSFDYNCDGKLETEIGINVKCVGGLGGCTGGPGFASNPACGTAAPYETCVSQGFGQCNAVSTMTATQACN